MKKISKTILFFGNERLATGVTTSTPTLRALIEAGYDIAAVIIAQNEVIKSRQARKLEISQVAADYNIPILSPNNLIEASENLASFKAEAGVLVAYGKLVPETIINLFPKGIINIHPSLLPLHRGPTPIESVILDSSAKTGVSLMKLTKNMDSGPVYVQEKVTLNSTENKQELADKLSLVASQMIIKNLPAILDGSLDPIPQNDSIATYDKQIEKADGQIDWKKPAMRLEREIQAYYGWPRSRVKIGSIDIVITKAHTAKGNGQIGTVLMTNQQLGVYTSEGLLMIDSLIPLGKKEMPTQAFLSGYKNRITVD